MSSKRDCLCPHCGDDLAESGVVELRWFHAMPNEEGMYNRNEAQQLWDIEGIVCGECSEELDYDMLEGERVMLYA